MLHIVLLESVPDYSSMSSFCEHEISASRGEEADLHPVQVPRGRRVWVPPLHGHRGSPQEGICQNINCLETSYEFILQGGHQPV